jgi:hypothetical protein
MYHCDKLRAIALTKYIRENTSGKALKERREALMTHALASGRIPNNRQNRRAARKKIKQGLRPNQALIDKYVRSFLIGKTVPFSIKQIMDLANAPRRLWAP